jgi:acetyl esterase/lipase
MLSRVFIAFGVFLFVVACKKNDSNTVPARTEFNVSYSTHAQQKMDIYLPAGRNTATTRVMILIHGGGWNAGDKADFNAYIDSLKKREPSYAIFNINYRLANPPDLFPAQELDVKAAVEFIYNKRSEYLISEKFVLLGASAGAHLALLQGFKYPLPVKPKAIIDFFGPADLVELYNNPPNQLIPVLLFSVTGATPASNLALYQQSSPVNFITAQASPTLILQGGADLIVPKNQSDLLNNKLQTAGVNHKYIVYPLEGHGWVGANLTDSFNQIQAFLATYVN